MKQHKLIWIFALFFVVLTFQPLEVNACSEKEQLFDNHCYSCDPETGYLQFNPNDRSVLCVECSEGFIFNKEIKECELKPSITTQQRINFYMDFAAQRISNIFKTDNILIGFLVIFIISIIIIYYFISWVIRHAK